MRVSLLNTLVSIKNKTGLLSVPFLVNKGIYFIFMPFKAFLIYLYDDNCVLCYEMQRSDGQFYISYFQESIPVDTSGDD